MKLKTIIEDFEDKYHPLHLYCRLVELELSEEEAWELSNTYEKAFYKPVLNLVKS